MNLKSILTLLLLVIIALLAGFYAPDIIHQVKDSKEVKLPTKSSQYCALSTTPCKKEDVSITLSSDIAQPLTETDVNVSWPGNPSDKLMLTLRGLEMDLGVVKFPILRQKDGNFHGTIVLPICTYQKMTWIGTLLDENGKQIYTSIRMEQ